MLYFDNYVMPTCWCMLFICCEVFEKF